MSEAELQSAVIECAQLLGWKVAHFRAAQTAQGWLTPVQADGKGFPDLVLIHSGHHKVLFVELKAKAGRLSVEQQDWLHRLLTASCSHLGVEVWRPDDWISGHVERVLRGATS